MCAVQVVKYYAEEQVDGAPDWEQCTEEELYAAQGVLKCRFHSMKNSHMTAASAFVSQVSVCDLCADLCALCVLCAVP